MRVAIKTLGCKSNRYESDKIFEGLSENFEVFELNEGATTFKKSLSLPPDFIIVNTCTVTESADRKSKQAIRSYKKAYPSAKIIVFGCGSNASFEEYKKIEEADFVLKNREEIVGLIKNSGKRTSGKFKENDGLRTRAIVKIQDGCNNFCSYCIIPRARGKEVSFTKEAILKEVLGKEAQGFKEIVLSGMNIGNWQNEKMNLTDLIDLLLKKTRFVRFRISSIEPENFSEKFLNLFRNKRLCPHLHMSLQSGSDEILKKMRRNYDAKMFFQVCEKLKKKIKNLCLTTDVIVGFPGETSEDFEKTCELTQKIGFLKVHVFPFSRRENTPAYYMKNQIPEKIKKERAAKLKKIDSEMSLKIKKSFLGKKLELLTEKHFKGFTENYLPVRLKNNDKYFPNKIVEIMLKGIDEKGFLHA